MRTYLIYFFTTYLNFLSVSSALPSKVESPISSGVSQRSFITHILEALLQVGNTGSQAAVESETLDGTQLAIPVYVTQAEESLADIAATLETTEDTLETLNPSLATYSSHVGGFFLNVSPSTSNLPNYGCQPNDTLASIASMYGVTVEALEAANPDADLDTIETAYSTHSITIGAPTSTLTSLLGTAASTSTTSAALPTSSGGGGGYIWYSGAASNFPSPSLWASYNTLWLTNSKLMSVSSTASEIAILGQVIPSVSFESRIDPRFILAVIMQESGGNMRVRNTNNGVLNTGIMQAHTGAMFDPAEPEQSIRQMVVDGVEGTALGDGLRQAMDMYGDNVYVAARKYNSGSVNLEDLSDGLGSTSRYVSDIANRLMGHAWPDL